MESIRNETILFSLKLDYDKFQQYETQVKLFGIKIDNVVVGDMVNISYRIDIAYFGNMLVERLKLLEEMAQDPQLMIKVNIDELNHGTCILRNALKELEKWTN